MRNERKVASVLNVRCIVAFFRSKVVASWRRLVVFIVYDGRAVELNPGLSAGFVHHVTRPL